MKIVLGVDNLSQGDLVLKALGDLRFASAELKLINVIEVWVDPGSTLYGFGTAPYNMQAYFEKVEEEARSQLTLLKESAARQSLNDCETKILYGHISNQLLDYADATHSELLAIGSFGKGAIESMLIGSVGRKALINSKRSVLIIKPAYRGDSRLSVVLATDHSPYADLWLDRFIQWAPQGVKHLHLVSVLPEIMFQTEIGPWICEGLKTANERTVQKLQSLNLEITTRVEIGQVSDTLARVMEETQSDLLILGSQGHGFMERMALGSISLEQAMKRPYSVLVVRA